MKLLKTYDDKAEAERALGQLSGTKRLASERDSTEVIYNLFGQPTWTNLYKLDMFELPELKALLQKKNQGQHYDRAQHQKIISMLQYAAQSFDLEIPPHWL